MSDLVIVNEDPLILQVTPESKPSIEVTTPPDTTLTVHPKEPDGLLVIQEEGITVQVTQEPDISITVDTPPPVNTVVVTGGHAVRATSIAHLSDVAIEAGVGDRSMLVYDLATQRWVPKVDPFNEVLDQHVNSPTPHPAYDEPDGPSLLLLYQNAKV